MSAYTPHFANPLQPDNVPQLPELATPAYLFDPAAVIEDYLHLRHLLGTPLIVSLKANPVIDLLARCIHAFEDGIEVASLGELSRVTGRTRAERFVNSPALDEPLLRAALAARANVVVDGVHQAEMLAAHAAKAQNAVMLRVNAAEVGAQVLKESDHFGMDAQDVVTAGRLLQRAGVRIAGLHLFAGSRRFLHGQRRIAAAVGSLLDSLEAQLGQPLSVLNLGGGFPESFRELPDEFAAYRASLQPLQSRIRVVHESGRAIFARCGQFLTRIVALKSIRGRRVAICDGGMAHSFLLAQTESLLKQWRIPRIVPPREQQPGQEQVVTEIYGNTCNRADRIGQFTGPQLAVGDICVFDGCGAYHHTYTVVDFLSVARAKVYLRNGPLPWA